MLPALKKVQFKGKVVFDHLFGDHNRIDGRHVSVVPVVPDKQGRHMGTGIIDKVQLRRTVFCDFGRIRIIELRIFLDRIGVIPGGIGDHAGVRPDVLRCKSQPLRQTGRIPLGRGHGRQAGTG